MDLKRLQNGSDIRGVACDGIPGQEINLTDDAVAFIASAFGVWLSENLAKPCPNLRVAIGRDSRITGEHITDIISNALTTLGISVFDTGLASTPAMFMATVTPGYDFDGAVMVTASHLPFNRNGMKFFTKKGGLEKADINRILTIAEKCSFPTSPTGKYEHINFMSIYAATLIDKIRTETGKSTPLSGYKIVVDAGNGAGGFFAKDVLLPLGADISSSIFLAPDGTFPNHAPNPEDKAAIAATVQAVKGAHADLGILFDTDVDRAGAVDSDGNVFNKNRFIALMAAIILEEHPGTTIVTDSTTSTGLKKFIEAHGGVHYRFKRGYRNVINEAIALNASGQDCQLAMETSGHGALKENYFLDDGAYLIVKLLIKLAQLKESGKSLSDLIADLEEPVEAVEHRLPITAEDFKTYGNSVIDALTAHLADLGFTAEPVNHEGIRAYNETTWFLLRLSLHEPLLPLNIESSVSGGVAEAEKILCNFFSAFPQLDASALR